VLVVLAQVPLAHQQLLLPDPRLHLGHFVVEVQNTTGLLKTAGNQVGLMLEGLPGTHKIVQHCGDFR